ncbi:unnamed protein product, partial [marine sediment metagenome]
NLDSALQTVLAELASLQRHAKHPEKSRWARCSEKVHRAINAIDRVRTDV